MSKPFNLFEINKYLSGKKSTVRYDAVSDEGCVNFNGTDGGAYIRLLFFPSLQMFSIFQITGGLLPTKNFAEFAEATARAAAFVKHFDLKPYSSAEVLRMQAAKESQ